MQLLSNCLHNECGHSIAVILVPGILMKIRGICWWVRSPPQNFAELHNLWGVQGEMEDFCHVGPSLVTCEYYNLQLFFQIIKNKTQPFWSNWIFLIVWRGFDRFLKWASPRVCKHWGKLTSYTRSQQVKLYIAHDGSAELFKISACITCSAVMKHEFNLVSQHMAWTGLLTTSCTHPSFLNIMSPPRHLVYARSV